MPPDRQALVTDLADAWRAIRAAEKFIRKKTWRRAVLLRSTRTAMVLRAVERAIGGRYVRREKGSDRRWSVYGRGDDGAEVLVAVVGGGSTRRIEDVRAPVRVELVAPNLIDVEALRRGTAGERHVPQRAT